ncbi:hypothetical protein RSP781_00045 [Ralstonia pseudosolanacearum]|nr:hypothetical protein RSP781_00045 [Ralstonia pseudosolanacearum]OAK93096.1 hypothetical protein AB851_01055 [Ralstonia pseudosolanacearum]
MQPKLFRRFDRQAQNHIGATLLACTQYRANPAKLQMHGTRFEYFLIQVPCRFVGFGRVGDCVRGFWGPFHSTSQWYCFLV